MKTSKTNDNPIDGKLTEKAIEIIQLEERLEMVQVDTLIASASCCMDSTEKAQ